MQCSWLPEATSILDDIKTLGREGKPAGTFSVVGAQSQGRGRQGRLWLDAGSPLAAGVLLRSQAPMGLLTGLAPVCGYACVRALKAAGVPCALAWPNDIVTEGAKLGSVVCEAGYGDGVFVAAAVMLNVADAPISFASCGSPEPRPAATLEAFLPELAQDAQKCARLGQDLCAAMEAECGRWGAAVGQGAGAAGPLGPILSAWFDEMPLMGQPVRALLPDGRVAAEGLLAGIDGWGRITVVGADGQERELSFEQASLRPMAQECEPEAQGRAGGEGFSAV